MEPAQLTVTTAVVSWVLLLADGATANRHHPPLPLQLYSPALVNELSLNSKFLHVVVIHRFCCNSAFLQMPYHGKQGAHSVHRHCCCCEHCKHLTRYPGVYT
ncbi:hypothetical protein UY3_16518 [Chelonia mydas]|uniref:Secreted protein n=1 Tax=Chelonia mydas TaxID=8469 RepID=M7APB5_CHEMY|nr:hypothetical protein UY3_16518 [Chelonia mydas]